jgi:phosphotransferase system HPr (HPr) family protein
MTESRRTVRVRNREGFHARSCTAIVQAVRKHRADVRIALGESEADAASVFDLMTLCAAFGDEVEVRATGEDADAVVEALAALFAAGFGEELG